MYLSHLITGITRAITASFTISKKRPDVHLGPKVPKVEAGLRTMEPAEARTQCQSPAIA